MIRQSKSGFGVVQGHWKQRHSIHCTGVPIGVKW